MSISFCHFVLGLTGADMCRESLRVQGVARDSPAGSHIGAAGLRRA